MAEPVPTPTTPTGDGTAGTLPARPRGEPTRPAVAGPTGPDAVPRFTNGPDAERSRAPSPEVKGAHSETATAPDAALRGTDQQPAGGSGEQRAPSAPANVATQHAAPTPPVQTGPAVPVRAPPEPATASLAPAPDPPTSNDTTSPTSDCRTRAADAGPTEEPARPLAAADAGGPPPCSGLPGAVAPCVVRRPPVPSGERDARPYPAEVEPPPYEPQPPHREPSGTGYGDALLLFHSFCSAIMMSTASFYWF